MKSRALMSRFMKLNFSFKREPLWIWVFSLAPAVLAYLFSCCLMLLR